MEEAAGSMTWMVLKTAGLLIVIVALIVLTLSVLRRIIRPGGHGASGQGALQVIGTLFLEPKKGIYLVKVVDRLLILGVTEGNISILEKVAEESEMEKMEQAFNGRRDVFQMNFSDKLRQVWKKHRMSGKV
jgi:flagellar protein FliO/FliZ